MRQHILSKADRLHSIKTFGNSMFPILQDGDVVHIRKRAFSRIKINDIVCFSRQKRLVTHRVVYVHSEYLVTKGDNNNFSDGKVSKYSILGIVEQITRGKKVLFVEDLYLLQSGLYFEEIKKITRILKNNNINFVLLKGLPLHILLEGKHPKRIYSDIDILVEHNHASEISKIFNQEGYALSDISLSHMHKRIKNKTIENGFVKFVGGYPVVFDVHYEAAFMMTQLGELNFLYPQRQLDLLTKELLIKKREVVINGCSFPMLEPELQLLYLFLHLFHHNYRGSNRFDIIQKSLQKSFDMEKLVSLISAYKLQNFVFPGLILFQKYFKNKRARELQSKVAVLPKIQRYINKVIVNIPIFDGEDRIESGVSRFQMLFYLSPRNTFLKIFTFWNQEVLFSIYWVAKKGIKSKLRLLFFIRQAYF